MSGRPSREAEEFLRRRRAALAADPARLGLDFIEVLPVPADPAVRRLVLHFVPAATNAAKHQALSGLTAASFRFSAGGVPVDGLFTVREIAHPDPDSAVVTLTVAFSGNASLAQRLGSDTVFTLELVDDPASSPPLVFDPFFSRVDFSLDPDLPLDEDCAPGSAAMQGGAGAAAVGAETLASDYLAKDYASFRQKMLDSLAQSLPTWQERNPADLLVTLVELLADAADQASYYQDAVATEAYLGTARLRASVRRHARLVGYTVQEGTNARVWVHFTAAGDGELPAGTRLLTRVLGLPAALGTDDELSRALVAGPTVFETLEPARLRVAHNGLPLYDWEAPELGLPRGATRATLRGSFPDLRPGDVLVLEEIAQPETGAPEAADPEHRHAVRLTRVAPATDPLAAAGAVTLTEIEWHPDDALPFPLCVTARVDGIRITNLAVARGNVALADHGRTVGYDETLAVPASGRFRPRLARRGLTHWVPYVPAAARSLSASTLTQDPAAALPALELTEVPSGAGWTLRRDLLRSDRFASDYVVEVEEDGSAVLRFGDGTLGRAPAPGTVLRPRYRVGNGRGGNIGRDSLYHLVTTSPLALAVRNPLPARGGTDPESIESVQLAAPGLLRTLDGRTAESDFARLAEGHPEVERAAATLRWSGSWYVLEVAVQRAGGQPADAAFLGRVRAFLEEQRQAGWEIVVTPLRFVGLDIALTVLLDAEGSRGSVERALRETFSNRDLAGGGRGFFHPDSLGFGQPVYLSRIVEAALRVPGVVAVDTREEPPRLNRFRRYGEPSRGELAAGQIRLGRSEIARVDNNPAAPRNGRIQFFLEGGR